MELAWMAPLAFVSLDAALRWLAANQPVLMGFVVWPLVSALLNAAFRRRTAAEWEAWALRKPGPALLIEVGRALGIDPAKVLVALERYATRRSGAVPTDVIAGSMLPPAIKALLADPARREVLEAVARQLLATPPPAPPPAGGAAPRSAPPE